jgi:iron complex transport system permease protein
MRKSCKIILLILLAVISVLFALSLGRYFISPLSIIDMLINGDETGFLEIIIELRLPRLLMALIIGASLAVSGVVFQAILKNPLAEPFLIGVSSGAALGASFAIVFYLSVFYIALGAFAGSIVSAFFVFMLSKRRNFGSSSLILSGISLSFVMWSTVLLVFAFSPSQEVHKAMLWLMGDLSIGRYQLVYRAFPFCLFLILLSYRYYRELNIISFGESFAESSGVSATDIRKLFWISSILAAMSVALAGVIGFVGLIIPHVVRKIFSANHKSLIWISAFVGAVFLVICDILSRTLAPPYVIPIGIITGFAGGIFFLIMMIRGGVAE